MTVSKSPAAPVTSIPAAAWLDQDDLRSGEPRPEVTVAVAPTLCGQRLLPPGFEPASMTAVGVRDGTYLAPGLPADYVPNGTIGQAIAVFGDEEGAARLMQRVEQASPPVRRTRRRTSAMTWPTRRCRCRARAPTSTC